MNTAELLEHHFEVVARISVEHPHDVSEESLYRRHETRELEIRQRIRDGEDVEQLGLQMISAMMTKVDTQLEMMRKGAGYKGVSFCVTVEAKWFRLRDRSEVSYPHTTINFGDCDIFDPAEDQLGEWCEKLHAGLRTWLLRNIQRGGKL